MAKGKKRKIDAGDVASNRQASYRFELLDRLECGLVLQGTEVKALRDGGAQLKDGYVNISDGELWLQNVHIPPYKPAALNNHEPERPRKLLAHRRQIERLMEQVKEKGLTVVPTRIYFKDGRAKIEIALGRGKDRYDKRDALKQREQRREVDRAIRDAQR
jgi:SsrA-binding protein